MFLRCGERIKKTPLIRNDLASSIDRVIGNKTETTIIDGVEMVESGSGSSRTLSAVGRSRTVSAIGSSRTMSAVGGSRTMSAVGGSRTMSAVGSSRARNVVEYEAEGLGDNHEIIDEITHVASRVMNTDPIITSSQHRQKFQRLKKFFRK